MDFGMVIFIGIAFCVIVLALVVWSMMVMAGRLDDIDERERGIRRS